MDRFYSYALSVVLLVGLGAAVLECSGGGPVCGNSIKEDGEDCDNGPQNGAVMGGCSDACKLTSTARASINLNYNRLKVTPAAMPNYPSPTCKELGVDKVEIVIEGPSAQSETMPCGSGKIYDVQPGMYAVKVTLLDAAGNPVTKPITSKMTDVPLAASPTNIMVEFIPEDYLRQDYKGTLAFVPHWGMMDKTCTDVTPAVAQQSLKLTPRGSTTPVTHTTVSGKPLDGTNAACFMKTGTMSYERIDLLPWGYYDLSVTGMAGGVMAYCQKFDVFVGPGVATPTYELVAPAASTDGGACP
jgi:hypothetical protein